jgi:predicted RNase H-like nuclease (RuvC/YqgF family)
MSIGNSRSGTSERDAQKNRNVSAKFFRVLADRYRALERRLTNMLGRGDRDYETLSVLSQEIGRIRQEVRQDLERRRAYRQRKKSCEKLPQIVHPACPLPSSRRGFLESVPSSISFLLPQRLARSANWQAA